MHILRNAISTDPPNGGPYVMYKATPYATSWLPFRPPRPAVIEPNIEGTKAEYRNQPTRS
jgi:hypothetical protein